jgi:hypothetical protein
MVSKILLVERVRSSLKWLLDVLRIKHSITIGTSHTVSHKIKIYSLQTV